ncbi:InlB B-repeat-containing protein [Hominenteromicrobium sp.]|uniref:InlB B-repeat-containing protein n=1 Tax=Hominenteromicrobium sp. TaxID=3073581 RepID=UPI003A91CD7C
MNKGAKDREVSRKYQQDISDVNYKPKKPAGVPANFTFAGWYDNEPCEGTAYVFDGKTMPAQNITLYAKWQAPVIEAKVYLTASADGEFKTIEILYGKKLSDSEDFKALLEKFKEEQPSAWIDSNGALFNVDTELYSSVTISPFFPSAKDGFTVTYVEDKNENVATDNQKYVSGSSARVLPPENSENFRAWKMEDGTLIHPGDKITVTKNTTLRAVYTNKPQTETITYHYNFEGSADTRTDDNGGKGYPRNTTATVKSLGEVNFAAPTGYKFLGWATTPDSNTVTYKVGATVFVDANGDNDLWAIWQVKTYTVTWVNWDDEVLQTEPDVAYNTMPKDYTGEAPTKPSDEDHDYKFTDWDKPLQRVTSNQVYKAQYEASFNVTYDLSGGAWTTETEDTFRKFENDQVNVIEAVPTKTGYTFSGWRSEEVEVANGKFTMPAKNVTLKAQWNINKYTVTWKNDDGSVLRTDKDIEYGKMPSYGANPTKAADAQYTYTFKSWTPEVKAVTGNAVYTAVYEKTVNKYTVTWKNDDGSVLRTDKDVEYGKMPSYGANPTKAADAQYTYTFKSWTPEVKMVTGDAVYTAVYDKEVNKYTIKWVNWDGSEVRTDTEVPYGTELEVPEDPTREADAQYTYTFKSWTPEVKMVTGDATYKATYTKEANTYTLTYDLDGGEWENDTTYTYPKKYNEEVEVKADPTKEGYTFAGWTSAEVEVVNDKFTMPAKNVTLTAKWVANIYKVTYDLDGGEWTEATNEFPYEYKATVEVVKTVPTREGYKFSGWRSEEVTIENDAFTMPAKDVVLKAVWEANPTPTPIPSEEPTPTPAPTEEPTPTPAPTEEPTPTPAPTEEPTPTPAPTEEPTPTPAPNPNPATPTPTPVAPVVPATVATPTPKPTATPSTTPSDNGGKGDGNNDGEIGETINDNETPLANGEDIADNATPLAGLGTGAWALINLILTIVTTLLSILLLIGYIGKKKKALEDEDGNVVLDENGKEVMEYEKNKKGLWRLISIIPALIAIIVFIFTEDMTLPMIFVDKWTILHVVIALVQVVVMVLCKKKKDENDEDENAANA